MNAQEIGTVVCKLTKQMLKVAREIDRAHMRDESAKDLADQYTRLAAEHDKWDAEWNKAKDAQRRAEWEEAHKGQTRF